MNSVAATQVESKAFGESVVRKVSQRLIPLIMLLYFISYLDRVNVGFAALTMNKDLGLSATVFGSGAGIFFLGYLLFEVPSTVILHKVGASKWIARIMITWGIISAGMAFTHGPISFYVLRFLLGVAEAGFFPGMLLYLTYWFPSAYRGKVTGLYMLAIPLSSVIGGPISGALLGLHTWGVRGWQWLFIMEGIPAVLLGLFVWFWLTDHPENAAWLTQPEKDWLVRELGAEQQKRESVHHLSLGQALLYPAVILFGVIHIGMLMASYGFNFWLPQIIKSFGGLNNLQVGFLTMVPFAFAAVAMYLWGLHSDRSGERVWHVVLPALLCGLGLACSAFLGSSSPVLALIALTAAAVGINCMLPLFWTLPPAMLSGTAAAGGIAYISAIGNMGSYFGPSIMGYLKDRTHNYTAGLLVLASFMLFLRHPLLLCGAPNRQERIAAEKDQGESRITVSLDLQAESRSIWNPVPPQKRVKHLRPQRRRRIAIRLQRNF